jgi:hypothetical protein
MQRPAFLEILAATAVAAPGRSNRYAAMCISSFPGRDGGRSAGDGVAAMQRPAFLETLAAAVAASETE